MLEKINKLTNWQAAIIIAVVGLAVFATGLTNPFQGDDIAQIVSNPVVHSIKNAPLFFEGGTFYSGTGHTGLIGTYYRPLMTTTFALLYTIFGAHAFYFHLLQLLLCIGSAFILYLFFRYSFSSLLALTLALIFLVHPINSLVAFAIPNMQDALFFFFGILALYLLVRLHSARSLLLVAACLFLSLLAKETGILFVAMAAVYLFWWDRKRLLLFTGVMTLPLVAWLWLRINAVGVSANPHNAPIDSLGLVGRLFTAPSIAAFYLFKLVFPLKLAQSYYWVYPNFSLRHVLLPLIIDIIAVALVVYLAIVVRKRVSRALYMTYWFFAIWTALGVLTYLQLTPLDMTVSDAWFYFSIAGTLGLIGCLLTAFQAKVRLQWFVVIAVLVIGLLGVRTALRGSEFRNQYSLASHDAASSKEDYTAETNLSDYYFGLGDYDKARQYAQTAIDSYKTPVTYNALGQAFVALGEYPSAVQALNTGLKYGNYYPLYETLGAVYTVYGNPTANSHFLVSAVNKYPRNAQLWFYLAIVEYKSGNLPAARAATSYAYRYDPSRAAIADTYERLMSGLPLNFIFHP